MAFNNIICALISIIIKSSIDGTDNFIRKHNGIILSYLSPPFINNFYQYFCFILLDIMVIRKKCITTVTYG